MTVQLYCFLADPEVRERKADGSYLEGTFTNRREARKYAQERFVDWAKIYELAIANELRWDGDNAFIGEEQAFRIRE